MQRISAPGHVNNLFSEGDLSIGVRATKVSADWLNAVQEELCNVIAAAGISLSAAKQDQLAEAVMKLIQTIQYATFRSQSELPTPPTSEDDLVLFVADAVLKRMDHEGNVSVIGDGLQSINGEPGAAQNIVVNSEGTDVGIASADNTHTISIPSASGSARGVITTGPQVIAGSKDFSDTVTGTKIRKFTTDSAMASASAPGLISNVAQEVAGPKDLSDTATGTRIRKFTTNSAMASATEPGLISTGPQAVVGKKTFNGGLALSDGDVVSGTYTPTITATDASSTVLDIRPARYIRVGKQVSLSGRFSFNSSVTGVRRFSVTLASAIATTFPSNEHAASGVMALPYEKTAGRCYSEPSGTRLQMMITTNTTMSAGFFVVDFNAIYSIT
jgi:hypothetical protein